MKSIIFVFLCVLIGFYINLKIELIFIMGYLYRIIESYF